MRDEKALCQVGRLCREKILDEWPARLERLAAKYDAMEHMDDPEGLLGAPSTHRADSAAACRRAIEIWKERRAAAQLRLDWLLITAELIDRQISEQIRLISLETAAVLRADATNDAAVKIADRIREGEI